MWQYTFAVSESGVSILIVFLFYFFRLLDALGKHSIIKSFVDWWPYSVSKAKRMLKLGHAFKIIEYVVCPYCCAVYNLEDCYEKCGSQIVQKQCKRIMFPNHPQTSRRKECGAQLVRRVQHKKRVSLVPLRVLCYNSIITSLQRLVTQPNFLRICEHWKTRENDNDLLGDIYDGQIWKDFQYVDGRPFLASRCGIALCMNVDWFQPFERTTESIGAIYFTVLNLPREERYKQKNIILSEIIPGPKEPKKVINSFLAPLVQELLLLWKGVTMLSPSNVPFTLRAAILCLSSDIPATRKLLGFVGHSATLGCSKCLKEFPSLECKKKRDYSGIDREKWKKRTNSDHREAAETYRNASSEAEQTVISSSKGVRYSILLELPYLDPVRFHVIDPMHNLLLGTAKHIMQIWTDENIIKTCHLKKLHDSIGKISSPAEVGRIPLKIMSSFSGFTADQWKNWTLIFSPIVLKDVLPSPHLRCWLLFVSACRILCSPVISKEDVKNADDYLVLFLRMAKSLYGPKHFTPNMHLHFHLKDCLLDYGPVYSFWCFAFERYNGILGGYHTNNKAVEPQFMRKFVTEQEIHSLNFSTINPDIDKVFNKLMNPKGRRVITQNNSLTFTLRNAMQTKSIEQFRAYHLFDCSKPLPPIYEFVMEENSLLELKKMMHIVYQLEAATGFSMVCQKFGRLELGGELLMSILSGNVRNSCVAAYWPLEGEEFNFNMSKPNVGEIQYFMRQQTASDPYKECIFAFVKWRQAHFHLDWFGSSAIVCNNDYVSTNHFSFIPVHRILCKCAYTTTCIKFNASTSEEVFVAVPLTFRLYT